MSTVLITRAGSTTGMNLLQSLAQKKKYRLIAIDSDSMAPGLYWADESIIVPKTSAKDYLKTLLDICRHHDVKVLLPGHSDELHQISKNALLFKEAGVHFAVAKSEVLDILDDKHLMGDFLASKGFDMPKEYDLSNLSQVEYPVFVKTQHDTGSKQTAKVWNKEELDSALKTIPKPIIQEFIDGDEFTIDVLSDLSGRVLMTSPRKRIAVQNGLCIKGITVQDPVLSALAAACVETFPIPGVSNVQIMVNNISNRTCLIEVNPRFPAGGLPLTIAAGLDIPELLIKMLLGELVQVHEPEPDVIMMRYWDSICLRKDNLKVKNR